MIYLISLSLSLSLSLSIHQYTNERFNLIYLEPDFLLSYKSQYLIHDTERHDLLKRINIRILWYAQDQT